MKEVGGTKGKRGPIERERGTEWKGRGGTGQKGKGD